AKLRTITVEVDAAARFKAPFAAPCKLRRQAPWKGPIRSKCKVPSLGHQTLPTKAIVRLFLVQRKASLPVKSTRCMQFALCPQSNFSIARLFCKAYSLVNKSGTNTEAACGRFHIQQSQFCNGLGFSDQKDGADDLTIFFGNPAVLLRWNEMFHELANDFRGQRL